MRLRNDWILSFVFCFSLILFLPLVISCGNLGKDNPSSSKSSKDGSVADDPDGSRKPTGNPAQDGGSHDGTSMDGQAIDQSMSSDFSYTDTSATPDAANHADSSPPDAAKPKAVDYLIIAGDILADSAQRYVNYRSSTGYTVKLALMSEIASQSDPIAEKISKMQALIKTYFDARDQNRPFYLLLLGDADDPVPTGTYVESYDNSQTTSDNVFADMNGDHLPDLAVGRVPAATNQEVDDFREKVEGYESTYQVGAWNRRINIIAASGGFGQPYDGILENLAISILDSLSYNYDISCTYGSQTSNYVYVPELFSDKVYQRLNEGSLVTAYMGHGHVEGITKFPWNGKSYYVMDETKLDSMLEAQNKLPIFIMIACLTGSFDNKDAFAERILRRPKGPVSVMAFTEENHPYVNAILTRELAVSVTEEKPATAGLLLMRGKYRLIEQNDPLRVFIEVASSFIPADQKQALKRTHLHMLTLLGDPGQKIQYLPGSVQISGVTSPVKPGSTIEVSASFDNLSTGTALFTVESRRKVILGEIQAVPADTDPSRDTVIKANYATANDKVLLSKEVNISSKSAGANFTIPANAAVGDYFIKVYAKSNEADAAGSLMFKVAE